MKKLNKVANAYSKAAQDTISAKMHKMKDEDRPQDQKVAIAMSEARKKGEKVPPPKKK
jgi:hypothetical protein